jgi:hypothetical protein
VTCLRCRIQQSAFESRLWRVFDEHRVEIGVLDYFGFEVDLPSKHNSLAKVGCGGESIVTELWYRTHRRLCSGSYNWFSHSRWLAVRPKTRLTDHRRLTRSHQKPDRDPKENRAQNDYSYTERRIILPVNAEIPGETPHRKSTPETAGIHGQVCPPSSATTTTDPTQEYTRTTSHHRSTPPRIDVASLDRSATIRNA